MSWITIAPVKVELNKSSGETSDDGALQFKVDAACAEIEDRMGHVDRVMFTETHDVGRDGQVILRETPVDGVGSIRLLARDGTLVRDLGPGTDFDPSGVLYGLPAGTVEISYTAGRNPVPPNFVEAAVQLAAHLWRQARSLDGQGRVRTETMIGPGMASAMPNKVKDLLGLTGKSSRSRVFVG